MNPKPNASYGALISIVIILAIVVVGAFYSWDSRVKQNTTPVVLPAVTSTTTDAVSTTTATTTP